MRNKLFVWGHNSPTKNKMSHGVVSVASVHMRVHISLLRGSIINGELQNMQMGFLCILGSYGAELVKKIVLTGREREGGLLLLPENVA